MITLKVEKYCHDCPDFKPNVNRNIICNMFDDVESCDTIITCKSKDRCSVIKKYIEHMSRKEECKNEKK